MVAEGKIKALAALGPTACGKTAFAVALARAFGGEIVGADSRQVYKGMDIGSGKDLQEYSSGGAPVPYHLIDIANPSEEYNLAEFHRDAIAAIRGIAARKALPIVAGGSALYIQSLLASYSLPGGPPDPALRETLRALPTEALAERLESIDPHSEAAKEERANRPRLIRQIELRSGTASPAIPTDSLGAEFLVLGVRLDRAGIHRRIEERLDARLKAGMLDEVQSLHDDMGLSWERLERFGLEYRYAALHLQGAMPFQEMRDALLAKIRQFAKRQDSWFRKMEREGLDIHWFGPEELPEAKTLVESFLSGKPLPKPAFRLMDTLYGPAQKGRRSRRP